MAIQPTAFRHFSRFFFAANAAELSEAYAALTPLCAPVLPPVADWAAVEFSFNRLFVGPRALQAPPYASIYLDGQGERLMGAATREVRQLFDMLGLTSPWLNQIPDDHLAFELDALWQIEQALTTVSSQQLEDARAFLRARLQRWLPGFVGRIQSTPQVHPAITAVAGALLGALDCPDVITTC